MLTPTLEASLKRNRILMFLAVEIVAPTFTLRLLDGGSQVNIGGNVFLGGDPTYGTVNAIEGLADGIGDQAPSCTITLNPPTNVGSANLASPTVQGSPVSVWFGSLDPDSGAYVDKYLWFFGAVDQCTLKVGPTTRTLSIACVTAWEAFFEQDTGTRLTNAWHQFVWPGELGLQYVTDVTRSLPWGAENTVAPPAQPARLAAATISSHFGNLD